MKHVAIPFAKTIKDFSGDKNAFDTAKKEHDDAQALLVLESKDDEPIIDAKPTQADNLLTVNGTFSLDKTDTGARVLMFNFKHNDEEVSARCGSEGSFLHALIVMKALKEGKVANADCYVGAPDGMLRKNYSVYGITNESLFFDYDLTLEQVEAIVTAGVTASKGIQNAKNVRTEVRQEKRALALTR
jgi:hypothetical protein